MRLVYKYRCYQHHEELMGLCKVSKNLYNQALYLVKTSLEQDNKFKFYAELEKVLKVTKNLENEVNYRLLKAQVAQQTIKIVDQNIRAYIKAIKDWSKNPDKYKGKPELPHYIKKNGYFELVYPNQSCSIKKGKIWLSKTLSIDIPQYDKYKEVLKEFNQVRVLPREGYVEIEIVYSVEDKLNGGVDPDRYASIDLGLGNLATMVTDFSEPIIYSGRVIKSKNQYFNKYISKAKSQLDPNSKRKTSKKIQRLWDKRNTQLTDIYHKFSREIVNLLLKNGVGSLIIGYNSGWKDSINIGRRNNQNFTCVSHEKFIRFLEYKCHMAGIRVIRHEESHTSKCDALAVEEICHHDHYLGKRTKRGLFQSSTGKLINADVNGALNIMRKVIGDSGYFNQIINSGRLFRPVRVNPSVV